MESGPATVQHPLSGSDLDFCLGRSSGKNQDLTPIRSQMKKTTQRKLRAQKTKPRLLSGGNPQIPKGDGDAPVRSYIAAMPGWKRDIGRRLDAIIERVVPGVRKAVKWNSPFYGA